MKIHKVNIIFSKPTIIYYKWCFSIHTRTEIGIDVDGKHVWMSLVLLGFGLVVYYDKELKV
jgi:hypothetical protein